MEFEKKHGSSSEEEDDEGLSDIDEEDDDDDSDGDDSDEDNNSITSKSKGKKKNLKQRGDQRGSSELDLMLNNVRYKSPIQFLSGFLGETSGSNNGRFPSVEDLIPTGAAASRFGDVEAQSGRGNNTLASARLSVNQLQEIAPGTALVAGVAAGLKVKKSRHLLSPEASKRRTGLKKGSFLTAGELLIKEAVEMEAKRQHAMEVRREQARSAAAMRELQQIEAAAADATADGLRGVSQMLRSTAGANNMQLMLAGNGDDVPSRMGGGSKINAVSVMDSSAHGALLPFGNSLAPALASDSGAFGAVMNLLPHLLTQSASGRLIREGDLRKASWSDPAFYRPWTTTSNPTTRTLGRIRVSGENGSPDVSPGGGGRKTRTTTTDGTTSYAATRASMAAARGSKAVGTSHQGGLIAPGRASNIKFDSSERPVNGDEHPLLTRANAPAGGVASFRIKPTWLRRLRALAKGVAEQLGDHSALHAGLQDELRRIVTSSRNPRLLADPTPQLRAFHLIDRKVWIGKTSGLLAGASVQQGTKKNSAGKNGSGPSSHVSSHNALGGGNAMATGETVETVLIASCANSVDDPVSPLIANGPSLEEIPISSIECVEGVRQFGNRQMGYCLAWHVYKHLVHESLAREFGAGINHRKDDGERAPHRISVTKRSDITTSAKNLGCSQHLLYETKKRSDIVHHPIGLQSPRSSGTTGRSRGPAGEVDAEKDVNARDIHVTPAQLHLSNNGQPGRAGPPARLGPTKMQVSFGLDVKWTHVRREMAEADVKMKKPCFVMVVIDDCALYFPGSGGNQRSASTSGVDGSGAQTGMSRYGVSRSVEPSCSMRGPVGGKSVHRQSERAGSSTTRHSGKSIGAANRKLLNASTMSAFLDQEYVTFSNVQFNEEKEYFRLYLVDLRVASAASVYEGEDSLLAFLEKRAFLVSRPMSFYELANAQMQREFFADEAVPIKYEVSSNLKIDAYRAADVARGVKMLKKAKKLGRGELNSMSSPGAANANSLHLKQAMLKPLMKFRADVTWSENVSVRIANRGRGELLRALRHASRGVVITEPFTAVNQKARSQKDDDFEDDDVEEEETAIQDQNASSTDPAAGNNFSGSSNQDLQNKKSTRKKAMMPENFLTALGREIGKYVYWRKRHEELEFEVGEDLRNDGDSDDDDDEQMHYPGSSSSSSCKHLLNGHAKLLSAVASARSEGSRITKTSKYEVVQLDDHVASPGSSNANNVVNLSSMEEQLPKSMKSTPSDDARVGDVLNHHAVSVVGDLQGSGRRKSSMKLHGTVQAAKRLHAAGQRAQARMLQHAARKPLEAETDANEKYFEQYAEKDAAFEKDGPQGPTSRQARPSSSRKSLSRKSTQAAMGGGKNVDFLYFPDATSAANSSEPDDGSEDLTAGDVSESPIGGGGPMTHPNEHLHLGSEQPEFEATIGAAVGLGQSSSVDDDEQPVGSVLGSGVEGNANSRSSRAQAEASAFFTSGINQTLAPDNINDEDGDVDLPDVGAASSLRAKAIEDDFEKNRNNVIRRPIPPGQQTKDKDNSTLAEQQQVAVGEEDKTEDKTEDDSTSKSIINTASFSQNRTVKSSRKSQKVHVEELRNQSIDNYVEHSQNQRPRTLFQHVLREGRNEKMRTGIRSFLKRMKAQGYRLPDALTHPTGGNPFPKKHHAKTGGKSRHQKRSHKSKHVKSPLILKGEKNTEQFKDPKDAVGSDEDFELRKKHIVPWKYGGKDKFRSSDQAFDFSDMFAYSHQGKISKGRRKGGSDSSSGSSSDSDSSSGSGVGSDVVEEGSSSSRDEDGEGIITSSDDYSGRFTKFLSSSPTKKGKAGKGENRRGKDRSGADSGDEGGEGEGAGSSSSGDGKGEQGNTSKGTGRRKKKDKPMARNSQLLSYRVLRQNALAAARVSSKKGKGGKKAGGKGTWNAEDSGAEERGSGSEEQHGNSEDDEKARRMLTAEMRKLSQRHLSPAQKAYIRERIALLVENGILESLPRSLENNEYVDQIKIALRVDDDEAAAGGKKGTLASAQRKLKQFDYQRFLEEERTRGFSTTDSELMYESLEGTDSSSSEDEKEGHGGNNRKRGDGTGTDSDESCSADIGSDEDNELSRKSKKKRKKSSGHHAVTFDSLPLPQAAVELIRSSDDIDKNARQLLQLDFQLVEVLLVINTSPDALTAARVAAESVKVEQSSSDIRRGPAQVGTGAGASAGESSDSKQPANLFSPENKSENRKVIGLLGTPQALEGLLAVLARKHIPVWNKFVVPGYSPKVDDLERYFDDQGATFYREIAHTAPDAAYL
ncbi:unnamed protein product [Amoebophrya sp. A25]|nr:unnamed protein product [Amoebophrya sp. A25]|eukprot:GSA25T00023309001.1